MKNISFSENILTIAGVDIALEHAILVAFELMGKVIVLFDPDEHIPKFGQFQNLLALDFRGAILWKAELLTTETGDCYYKVFSKKPLQVISYKSYKCEIEIDTGKMILRDFTK